MCSYSEDGNEGIVSSPVARLARGLIDNEEATFEDERS
jgi:hypothetical protein